MARPSTMLQVRVDSAWRLEFRHMYTGYRVMAYQWFKSSRRVRGQRVARTPVKRLSGAFWPWISAMRLHNPLLHVNRQLAA
jgi:hypothetical protein